MKKKIYNTTFLILFLISSCNKLEQDLDLLISNETFSGTVLIAEDNKILYSKGFGYADFEQKILNDASKKFLIGSITKQFTAACIMLLQEDGLLSISDPISDYLSYPLEVDITIENLLNHTSGIPEFNNTDADFLLSSLDKRNKFEEVALLLLQRYNQTDDDINSFEYRNSNYILLGLLIEKLSGFSYGEFIDSRIFKPLDMENSGSSTDFLNLENTALGYKKYSTNTNHFRIDPVNLLLFQATGDVYSTTEDLYKWHLALNENFLSEQSKNRMFMSKSGNYGLGWIIGEDPDVVYHSGAIEGYNSMMIRQIDENRVIIILSNFYNSISTKNVIDEICKLYEISI